MKFRYKDYFKASRLPLPREYDEVMIGDKHPVTARRRVAAGWQAAPLPRHARRRRRRKGLENLAGRPPRGPPTAEELLTRDGRSWRERLNPMALNDIAREALADSAELATFAAEASWRGSAENFARGTIADRRIEPEGKLY